MRHTAQDYRRRKTTGSARRVRVGKKWAVTNLLEVDMLNAALTRAALALGSGQGGVLAGVLQNVK